MSSRSSQGSVLSDSDEFNMLWSMSGRLRMLRLIRTQLQLAVPAHLAASAEFDLAWEPAVADTRPIRA